MIPPPNLLPMKDFNPAEPAILHDVVKAGLRYTLGYTMKSDCPTKDGASSPPPYGRRRFVSALKPLTDLSALSAEGNWTDGPAKSCRHRSCAI